MATVAQTLPLFFEQNPDAIVLFKGSDEKRTRLYQIIINKEMDSISQTFSFLGINGMRFEPFSKNKTYEGFAIILKNRNIEHGKDIRK